MLQANQVYEICTAIGNLAEITLGKKQLKNQPTVRLLEIRDIVQWAKNIKNQIQSHRSLTLKRQADLNSPNLMPSREDLLTKIDSDIQNQMQQLHVDVTLGTLLLSRVMQVVDTHMLVLLQQIDALRSHADSLQLNQAKLPVHAIKVNYDQGEIPNNLLQSQRVTTSQTIKSSDNSNLIQHLPNELRLATSRINQLQSLVSALQTSHQKATKDLQEAKNKNAQLVQQIRLSNSRIQEFQKKLLSNKSLTISNSANDANIKIISELKLEKQTLNNKINELVQQIIDSNMKVQELQKKLKGKSNNSSPVRQPILDQKSSNPKMKDLQNQLTIKQEQNNSLNIELRKADARINELISSLMAANGTLEGFRSREEIVGNGAHSSQEISSANEKIRELARKYSDANNRIVELQEQLQRKHYKMQGLGQKQQSRNMELSNQLIQAHQRIQDLINQVALSNNRVTDLELDIQSLTRQAMDNNSSIGYQKRIDALSHQLMVSSVKIEEMMKMVANYQNNVIDLQLDKQALVFQLNDSRNKQQQHLDELKVQKASCVALKQQIIKLKQAYHQVVRGNIKAIDIEIQNRTQSNRIEIQKPSQQRQEAIDYRQSMNLQNIQRSEKSHRQHHAHRKIFEGKARGSHVSGSKNQYFTKNE